MPDRPEHAEFDTYVPTPLPAWARGARLTKEQLAAAERTREYHVRKLESQVNSERPRETASTRSEH